MRNFCLNILPDSLMQVLQKEVAAESVLVHKQRSRERGAHGQSVADNNSGMGHEVTSRAVWDHLNMMTQ